MWKENVSSVLCGVVASAMLFSLAGGAALAETLNPEGINPHMEAPRKRITQEQKKAAWEARKKKAEIEAGKAAQKSAQPYDAKKLMDGEPPRKP